MILSCHRITVFALSHLEFCDVLTTLTISRKLQNGCQRLSSTGHITRKPHPSLDTHFKSSLRVSSFLCWERNAVLLKFTKMCFWKLQNQRNMLPFPDTSYSYDWFSLTNYHILLRLSSWGFPLELQGLCNFLKYCAKVLPKNPDLFCFTLYTCSQNISCTEMVCVSSQGLSLTFINYSAVLELAPPMCTSIRPNCLLHISWKTITGFCHNLFVSIFYVNGIYHVCTVLTLSFKLY